MSWRERWASPGINAFYAIRGDYCAGGYRTRRDTSILFSTNASSSRSQTKRSKPDVEWPFGDCHEQSTTASSSMEQSAVVHVSVNSTIEQALVLEAIQTGTPEFQAAISRGRGVYQRTRGLDDSVLKFLKEIGTQKAGW
ncbi:hypothetical protein HDV63DRAFT_389629 [Trichoderma sp. SZMC 28014]